MRPMIITTRLATVADIETIRDLTIQYHREFGSGPGPHDIPAPEGPQGMFNVLLAEQDGEVLGMLALQRVHNLSAGTRYLLLSDIFVPPRGRRHGVARELMRAVRDLAPTLHCQGMSLVVSQVNIPALTTAARAGFTSHDLLLFTYSEDG